MFYFHPNISKTVVNKVSFGCIYMIGSVACFLGKPCKQHIVIFKL